MEHFNSSYISHFLLRGLLYSISVRTSSSYYTYCIHTHSHIVHIIFIHSFIHSFMRSFVRSYILLCLHCVVCVVLYYFRSIHETAKFFMYSYLHCFYPTHSLLFLYLFIILFWTILCVCWIIFSITWFNTYLQRARTLPIHKTPIHICKKNQFIRLQSIYR